MPQLTAVRSRHENEWRLRIDLAASFRLAAEFGWHEGVANHFSVAVSDDGRKFLMNPKWKHFSTIRASDLLLLDADDPATNMIFSSAAERRSIVSAQPAFWRARSSGEN